MNESSARRLGRRHSDAAPPSCAAAPAGDERLPGKGEDKGRSGQAIAREGVGDQRNQNVGHERLVEHDPSAMAARQE
jgi:hypothetical protein